MTHVIGLTGKAGSGKSTVAEFLHRRYDFTRIRFADRLKNMLRALGLTDAEIEGADKGKPCARLGGVTPRFAMQTLGTEWGRNLIDENLWVNLWADDIKNHPLVVVEDVRFPNEFAMVRILGGATWRIIRPDNDTGTVDTLTGRHASETEQDAAEVDFNLLNNRGLRELYGQVEVTLRETRRLMMERKNVYA